MQSQNKIMLSVARRSDLLNYFRTRLYFVTSDRRRSSSGRTTPINYYQRDQINPLIRRYIKKGRARRTLA